MLGGTGEGFLKQIAVGQKWPKMVQNGLKTRFLDFLRKWCHEFCQECCKTRVAMIHQHSGKTECWILSSSYSRKYLLANEISLFFNHPYFFNRSSSDFDIWHVDRHEWKEQGLLTGFLKKKLSLMQISHLWSKKWCILITLDPLQEFFLKFYTLKSANR